MTNFIISKTLIIQRLSVILFLVVFIAIWVEEWDRIVSYITRAGLIAFILNMTMIFVGYFVAKFWTSGVAQRKCISLECGLQNGTLAVFVTTQLFDEYCIYGTNSSLRINNVLHLYYFCSNSKKNQLNYSKLGRMVELVDAPDSKSGGSNTLRVRVSLRPPNDKREIKLL